MPVPRNAKNILHKKNHGCPPNFFLRALLNVSANVLKEVDMQVKSPKILSLVFE